MIFQNKKDSKDKINNYNYNSIIKKSSHRTKDNTQGRNCFFFKLLY